MTSKTGPVLAADAWADYRHAAAAAEVEVRMVSIDDAWASAALLEEIWGTKPVEAPLLISLAHTGGYAAVAVDLAAGGGNEVVGATAGYFSQPLGTALHSHVAGVRPGIGRPGIGRVMKLHQRAWCLDLGVTEVTWTFDPLVSRNAHINISRFGVDVDEYIVDFYGQMTDGINAGQGSDRAVVRWHLTRPYSLQAAGCPNAELLSESQPILVVTPDGTPQSMPHEASAAVTVAIPRDVETLRHQDPGLAATWRVAVRNAMVPLLSAGWTVAGYDTDHGYLLERPTP